MDILHEWYDAIHQNKQKIEKNDVDWLKMEVGNVLVTVETYLAAAQQQKNGLKDRIDALILEVRACERRILELEEEMKAANEFRITMGEYLEHE